MKRRQDGNLRVLSGAVLFLSLFTLFARTHGASLYLDDSGETVTVAALLGIGHPPGYPLHSLLSHLWLNWPLGSLAVRLNLFAAACGALTATLFFAAMIRCQPRQAWAVAAGVAVLYASGPVFWHNALGAKGSIYQLNNLLSVAMLALLAWEREMSAARVRAFWVCFGLSLGHHYMSQLPMLPAYAWLLWSLPGRTTRWQRFGGAWLTIPGASLYAYLFLRSAQNPGLNWGAVHTLQDFWFFFFRLQYAAGEVTRSAGGTLRQGTHALGLLWREGSYLLLPVALVSAWALRRERLAQALALAWLASLGAVAFYLNLSVERLDLMQPYLFPAYLAQAALASLGLAALYARTSRPAARTALLSICLLLPLASVAKNYAAQDLSQYFYAEDNAANILRTLPRNALVFAQGDAIIFPLWYAQRVQGARPDVAVVGNAVLPMEWVRQDLQQRFPDLRSPTVTGPIGAESVGRLVQAYLELNADHRPVYALYNKMDPPVPGWHLVGEGLAYRLARDSEALPKDIEALPKTRFQACVIRGYTRRPLDERTMKLVVGDFAINHNSLGVIQEEAGHFEAALAWYRQATRLHPESPEYPFNAGNALNAMKRTDEALAAYTKATQVDPTYGSAWYNLGVTQYQAGHRDQAIEAFRSLLKVEPGREDIKKLLGQLGAGPV